MRRGLRLGVGVQGLGARDVFWGLRVWGWGFRVPDFGFWVLGFGFRASGFGFRGMSLVLGFGLRVSVLGVEFEVEGRFINKAIQPAPTRSSRSHATFVQIRGLEKTICSSSEGWR